jgi:hypothetical protein
MKKLLYILSLILFTSCIEDVIDPSDVTNKDGKVAISFNVSAPDSPETKAMGETATLNNLYLFCEQDGNYIGCTLATKGSGNSYTSYIPEATAHIHFIANLSELPQDLSQSIGSSAIDVIKNFIAEGNEDIYWRYLSKSKATDVKLTRNFAKISVVQAENANFELQSYTISDIPTQGYAAAIDRDGTIGEVSSGLSNYTPAVPGGYPDSDFYRCSGGENWSIDDTRPVNAGSDFFLYEMPYDNKAFIIARCKYPNDSNNYYYYKIDLKDKDGSHFNIKRNEHYTIYLNYATGPGYDTVDEAVNGEFGRISTTASNKDHTLVTNGTFSLSVSYTEIVLSDPADYNENRLYYDFKYYDSTTGTQKSANGSNNENGENVPYFVYLGFDDNSPYFDTAVLKNKEGENIWYADVKCKATFSEAEGINESILTVKGRTTSKSFVHRDIRFITMPKQALTPSVGAVEASKGTVFDLNITIPSGLENYTSMFPIDFFIEPESNTVTPSEAMSTEVGESVSGSGKPAYQFIKSLTLSDYLALEESVTGTKTFSCKLKTTADNSGTTIYVASKHFNTQSCSFTATEPANGFRDLLISQVSGYPNPKNDDGSYRQEMVYVSFSTAGIPKGTPVTVTLSGGLVPYTEGPYENILTASPATRAGEGGFSGSTEGTGGANTATYTYILSGKPKEGFYLSAANAENASVLLTAEVGGEFISSPICAMSSIDENLRLYQVTSTGDYISSNVSVGTKAFVRYEEDGIFEGAKKYSRIFENVKVKLHFNAERTVYLQLGGLIPDPNESNLIRISDDIYNYSPMASGEQEVLLNVTSLAGKVYVNIYEESTMRNSIVANRRINAQIHIAGSNCVLSPAENHRDKLPKSQGGSGAYLSLGNSASAYFVQGGMVNPGLYTIYAPSQYIINSEGIDFTKGKLVGIQYRVHYGIYREESRDSYYLNIDMTEDFSENGIHFNPDIPYLSQGLLLTSYIKTNYGNKHEIVTYVPFNDLAVSTTQFSLINPFTFGLPADEFYSKAREYAGI